MDSTSNVSGQGGRQDDIEVILGRNELLQPALLEIPSRMTLGESASPHIDCGNLRLRSGRRPIAHSLQALYRRAGHNLPEEFEIFWNHDIWLINHSVGVLRQGEDADIEDLCYELRFPEGSTVLEALPQARYLIEAQGKWRCEADLHLNGRATESMADIRGKFEWEDLHFGGRMKITNQHDLAARVTLDVMTPLIQAMGIGDNVCQFMFSRHQGPLSGYQSVLELLLVDKYIKELPCAARLQGTVAGLNGVQTRLRTRWIPSTIRLTEDHGPA